MKLIKKKLNGVYVFKLSKYSDKRGFFSETYKKSNYEKYLKNIKFKQDNISLSNYGVVRGLHYQIKPHEQGKLVNVIKGKIFDVVLDIRKISKSYGKYFSIILSEKNNYQIWIPNGFAHGFMSLSNETIIKYSTTNEYSPKNEKTIFWKDKRFNIKWPKHKNIVISDKDKKLFI